MLFNHYCSTQQSLPSDMQKIRTALAGLLYAYEIPLPTISCEDKSSSSTTPVTEEEKELCNTCSIECDNQISANQTETSGRRSISNNEESVVKESKCPGTNSEISTEVTETKLKVQDDWFGEAVKNKKKVSSSPVKRLSPKLPKRISPKFNKGFGGLSATLRKTSHSLSSMELTEGTYVSNSDSGISLSAENSPTNRTRSVPASPCSVSRNPSDSCTPIAGPAPYLGYCFSGFVVAMHRKTVSCVIFYICLLGFLPLAGILDVLQ